MSTDQSVETDVERPALRIKGEAFDLVETYPSQWALMRLSSAMNSGDEMRGMGQMYDFIMGLVQPEERARLDAHLDGAGDLTATDLDTAIGDALVEMAGRGNGSGPERPASSPPASGGTPVTPTVSRRVSLSAGTVHPLGAGVAEMATGSAPTTS